MSLDICQLHCLGTKLSRYLFLAVQASLLPLVVAQCSRNGYLGHSHARPSGCANQIFSKMTDFAFCWNLRVMPFRLSCRTTSPKLLRNYENKIAFLQQKKKYARAQAIFLLLALPRGKEMCPFILNIPEMAKKVYTLGLFPCL